MIHEEFIISPITKIITDAIYSININSGIGVIAMKGFFEQSLFLQLTGVLEQKCKCIQWELATNDYEYRYKNFYLNEPNAYSTFSQKNNLFLQLINKNKESKLDYKIDRQEIFNIVKTFVETFWGDNIFSKLYARNYTDYFAESELIKNMLIKEMVDKNGKISFALLINRSNLGQCDKDKLSDFGYNECDYPLYETIYAARNRLAHNTKCYQTTKFAFADANKNRIVDNFVVWLITLSFIDEVYIKLFRDAFNVGC